jgi:hypothetical protein
MGLIDLKTNLKSLKYGNDQQGGGSSGQPFIVTPIPEGYAPKSIDFLLRNGILNPNNSITDAERLTKFFATTSGILFTTKQIALERQNPKLVNTNRIYLPTSTILQAGVLSTGTHLNKQGLNPFQPLSYFSGGTTGYYFSTKGVGESPIFQTLLNGDVENRLTIAYTAKIANQSLGTLVINPFGITGGPGSNPNVLLSYNGGPNSDLGFGTTSIRIQNPTITLKDVYTDGASRATAIYDNPNNISALDGQNFLSHKEPNWIYDITKQGASARYQKDIDFLLGEVQGGIVKTAVFTDDPTVNLLERPTENVTNFDNKKPSTEVYGEGIYAYTGEQIGTQQGADLTVTSTPDNPTTSVFSKTKSTRLDNLTDYRYVITNKFSSKADPLPSTNYSKFNRETTYGTSRTNYKPTPSADEINNLPVTSSAGDNASKDIIKFYFELIGNDRANSFLFFRAYLNNLSDAFSPQWDSYKYVGRAENFYKYNGFSRDINLEFTIYGHTQVEMKSLYQKLNRLVGSTAPDYGSNLMKGNFIKLTIGDYLLNVPGFIKNITLTPSFEAGWDINRGENGELLTVNDTNIGQVPKLINVSLGFTPIHSFTPTNTSTYIRNI